MTSIPPASPPEGAPGEEPAPPVRLREPAFRIPPATGWLIALNVLVQILRHFLPSGQDEAMVDALGFDPASIYRPIDAMTVLSLISYQFLHGGWDHLAINMVSLLAFGAGVERPLGWVRFVGLYLACGVVGALVEAAFTSPRSDDLLIGASASISGVFGALLVIWGLYRARPGARSLGVAPMAILWIVLMAVTGYLGVGAQGAPVAWIAHIGGFLAGMAFGFAFRPAARKA